MKRSEMIEQLIRTLRNEYPGCDEIRDGMDMSAALAVLKACEEAGMMPPCSKKGLIRFAAIGEPALIAQSYPAEYEWEPE